MTQLDTRPPVTAAEEVARLMKSLEALANPCCRGHATSVFKIMGRDGGPAKRLHVRRLRLQPTTLPARLRQKAPT